MSWALFLVKSYLVPGSPMFLIIAIAIGLALIARPALTAWGRRWLAAVLILHTALSVPAISGWLQRSMGGVGPIMSAADAGAARIIVVLGTGVVTVGPGEQAVDLPSVSTASNIAEAARLYRMLGRPRVIASGGMPPGGAGRRPEAEVIRPFLLRLGVADADIALESRSINTIEQAGNVAAMLPPGTPVVLVTVPTHMRRAAALFRTRGLTVTPAVSDSTEPRLTSWTSPWTPNRYALRASEMAVYEALALGYYGARGELR
jgi:uncharacterized SAM-binding protein YcdF (DUF218 family)